MGVEVVHQPVHGLGRWMGFGNPRKGLGKLRRLAMGRGVSVMTTAGGLDENIRRSRFRRARIHSRGARPGLAPSEYQVAPNPAVAPAVRPGRPLATRGSARWLRISHTSSIRRTYSCPASRHPHIFSRHGFSSWRVNSRRMVSRRPWRTSPRRLASFAVSTMVHRARPFGGGPHTIATIAAGSLASSSGAGLGRGWSLSAAANPRSK